MKRFTETLKWEDPWFRRLSPEMKLLWQWICDRCDNAGVIDPDMELASFQIGYSYPMDTLSGFGDRLAKLECGKWFIPKFIPFQYGELSEDCRAHKPIFMSLQKHHVNGHFKGYSKGINTLQEKEKEKEKEKDQDKEESPRAKSRGTVDEFRGYAVELGLDPGDGEYLHAHLCENGWKRGKDQVKDWKATVRKWKQGGWLPSQKNPKPSAPKQYQFIED